MKRRVFAMSYMQVLYSPIFYFSVIGVVVLSFLSVWDELSIWGPNMSVAYYFDIFIGLTMYKKLVVLFAALPYVSSFCSDWKSQYIKPVVIRTGIKKYVWSKVITCYISGLLTVFIGLILFITLLSLKIPMFPNENIEEFIHPPFAQLALGNFPILYIIIQCFVFSMAAALWTMVGLAFSAYLPNHFVAIAASVIASYVLEELSTLLPSWLNLYYLTRSLDVIHQGPLISFVYFSFIFILFSILAGIIFDYQVRRRIHNEVV